MFKKQGIVFWIVGGIVLLVILWQTGMIEHLTGNAPKELPLPSQMKPEDDKGRIGTYDKRFLDTREIPTGYDTLDTDYMLSPSTISRLQSGTTIPTYKNTEGPSTEVDFSESIDKSDVKRMSDEIALLKQEIQDLKKQTTR